MEILPKQEGKFKEAIQDKIGSTVDTTDLEMMKNIWVECFWSLKMVNLIYMVSGEPDYQEKNSWCECTYYAIL